MMKIYLLQVFAVRSKVSERVKRPIHIGGITRPQGKLHKEIGGLEGKGEGLWEAFDCLWAVEGLYWELDSFRVKALCNLDHISTCMIIQRWGFR